MKYLKPTVFLMMWLLALLSCTNPKIGAKATDIIFDGPINRHLSKQTLADTDSIPTSRHLYLKNDSLYIVTKKKIYAIQNDTTIDYKHAYDGIYELSGGRLTKRYNLVIKDHLYFTTYEVIGMNVRGRLYAYDLMRKALIKDKTFFRDYLNSKQDIFIIDQKADRLFTVSTEWYERKGTSITSASMYSINGDHFKYYKSVYEKDDKTDSTSLIKFYNKSLINNAKRGVTLPKDWSR